MRCLCNLLNYEGSIKIDGIEVRDYKSKDLAKKITLLSQYHDTYFDYKSIDIVKFARYSYRNTWQIFNTKENELYINEILKNMGIYDLRDKYMSELSGGEKQKIYLARVLAQDTKIILLDEPSNNLDIQFQIYLFENIPKWCKNKILVVVSHDLNFINVLDDKIMLLKDSKIFRYGKSEDVFTRDNLEKVYNIDIGKFMLNSLKQWEKGRGGN